MKTKVPIVLFLICFFMSRLVFAQSFEKIIEYDPDYKIIDITSSENYYCITLKANDQNYIAEVFNKNLAKIFSQKSHKSIVFAYVLEPENYIVLITDEYNEIEGIHLMARGYSIENGQLSWETKFYSGPYELSPNGRMLLNKNQIASEPTGPLSILYLHNGQIISFSHLENIWSSASWFNNARITLVKRVRKENPGFSQYINEINRKSEVINEEIRSINIAYHNGEIGFEEYKAAKSEKFKELAVLRNGGKQTRGKAIMNRNNAYVNQKKRPKRFIQTASKFSIFNINTELIETSTSLFDKEGKPIIVSYKDINTDRDGNTYVSTNDNLSVRLLKLNEQGKTLWSTKPRKGVIKFMKYNMTELVFLFKDTSKSYSLIDLTTGTFIKEQDIPNHMKQIINYLKNESIPHIFSNLIPKRTNGKITIYLEEK